MSFTFATVSKFVHSNLLQFNSMKKKNVNTVSLKSMLKEPAKRVITYLGSSTTSKLTALLASSLDMNLEEI